MVPATTRTTAPGASVRAVWGALWIVYLVWGSTYLAISVMDESIPPLVGSAYRFALAGSLLGGFLLLRRGPSALRVTRRQLANAALLGTLLIGVGNGGVAYAELYLPSGLTALLVAATPLWVAVLRGMGGDRPSRLTLLGVVGGFAGIGVLVLPGGWTRGTALLGILGVLAATLCWASGSYLTPRVDAPRNPFVLSAYEMWFGSVALLAFGLVHREPLGVTGWSGRSTAAWCYLVVIGSLVGFSTFVWLTTHAPISLVTTYAYVNPVVAVILGWTLRGDELTGWTVLGGAIVVLSVVAVIRGERRPVELSDEPGVLADEHAHVSGGASDALSRVRRR